MTALLLGLFRLIWLLKSGHRAVVLENLALRQQLAVYRRKKKRPRLVRRDRWFWSALPSALPRVSRDWTRALIVVHPDTVVRCQRQRFRRYWAQLSNKAGKGGRPPIGRQLRELVQTMASVNPLWRAPRIHGELLKLGIEISERTVSRLLRTAPRPPSQSWKTFLQNHVGELVATDFFTVPVRGAVCVPRVGAAAEESAPLRSHGVPDRRMGRSADGRGLRRARSTAISYPRP